MIDINLNLPIDTTPTNGSTNLIDSNAVFDSLELSKLHDVNTTGAVSGNVLALDGSVWKPANISSGITIGTTPITSGVAGRVLFEGAGNVMQEDANFTFNSTLKRLTLKAAGALSTDIVQVWRNSADTANLLSLNGLGNLFLSPPTLYGETAIYADATNPIIRYTHDAFASVALGYGAKVATTFPNYTDAYNIAIGYNASTAGTSNAISMGYTSRCIGTYGVKIGHHQGASAFGGINSIHLGRTTSGNNIEPDNVFMTYFNSQSSSTLTRSNGSFGLLGQQDYILGNGTGIYGLDTFMGNGGNTLVIANHTSVPSTNIANAGQIYVEGGALKYRGSSGTITVLGVA